MRQRCGRISAEFRTGEIVAEQSDVPVMSLRIKPIYVRRTFSPNDDLAVCIVRICVLREDMLLEVLAFLEAKYAGEISGL